MTDETTMAATMANGAKNGNGSQPAADAGSGTGQGILPLFYSAPEALSPERHGGLGLDPGQDVGFAARTQAVPITLAEFPAACRTYPIVFVGSGTPQPVAIVGLHQNENLFVEADGRWADAAYVPGYVRRYPYILVRENSGENFALCVDRASPRLREGGEMPLFVDGKPSEWTEKALEFCAAFQRQASTTEAFVKRLQEHDLLVPNQAQFTLKNGDTVRIADYMVIDERKLQALPDEVFLALRHEGVLAGIYCQLVSSQSWGDLARRAQVEE
ncbi:SapC protein [Breoghania corrubedonensis]|uniref:SapC protein n=1 Tax=Breoghania corrubedonensis TaxID=665038 RepID=A0A2T5V8I1_9HYPH|nr:SapC family protein [Breoghania corrubedonensis]PTW60068.1 SapC protein [Breoghania corrubedonensis]